MASGKPAKAAAPAATGEVDEQMQKVLQLLSARTNGKATNEEVETAVTKILSAAGLGPPPSSDGPPKKAVVTVVRREAKIELDTENYDDDDDDEEGQNMKMKAALKKETANATTSTKRKRPGPGPETLAAREERKRQYDKIPLGKQGAHMMTSFGDGPRPLPTAVEAVLLGARKLLQVTIQDARALRRKTKQQFQKAQIDVAKTAADKIQRKIPISAGGPETLPDPEMLYRAYIGYDKMNREAKCGFNYEQLKALFPEEMRAYSRWNQMRNDYQRQNDEKEKAVLAEEGGGEPVEDTAENDNEEMDDPIKGGGHLQIRAEQFDVRTDHMDKQWYMQFSEHRKGSFLPKQVKTEGDNEWEENRKKHTKSNQHKSKDTGIWANMSAKSARFLHWVGFDPDKGLPPPNNETTQALAFLGYDFLGRIVEKAIFLKNLSKLKDSNDEVDERTIRLELQDGEQLRKEDIDRAMDDMKPAAIYCTTNDIESSQRPIAQLYFGPGCEDRLEMELDELILASHGTKRADLTEEEGKIRQEEDKLFEAMSAPPTTNASIMHLLGKEENDGDEDYGLEEDTPAVTGRSSQRIKLKSETGEMEEDTSVISRSSKRLGPKRENDYVEEEKLVRLSKRPGRKSEDGKTKEETPGKSSKRVKSKGGELEENTPVRSPKRQRRGGDGEQEDTPARSSRRPRRKS